MDGWIDELFTPGGARPKGKVGVKVPRMPPLPVFVVVPQRRGPISLWRLCRSPASS